MIKIIEGDITNLEVDIIVNAANEFLEHGGGVARAIAEKAGEQLIRESRQVIEKRGKLGVGEAVFTNAGQLKAAYVIHVVGPRDGDEIKLGQAIISVFELAKILGSNSIALPAVSCGVFGFDKKEGAEIIYQIAEKYEEDFQIILCSIDKEIIGYWEELSH